MNKGEEPMEKKPITNKVLWIFALGQFGWSLLSGVISTWLVHLYAGNAALGGTNGIFSRFIHQTPILASLTLFGVITAVGRLFDAVTDPLIASLSDRSSFKGGRRIPFMKAIAIPFAAVTVAVFCVPVTSSIVLNDTLIFALLMLFYLFMTVYCTPYNALIAELGDTQEHRINVSTYISFTYIAGFSIATFMPNLAEMLRGFVSSEEASIRLAIGVLCAIAALAMLIPALYIKERAYIDSKPVRTPAFRSLVATFKDAQFRRFVYADVIYFFAVTLFQTGLADFETNLMGISSDNTFLLTVLMTVISLSLYPLINRLAPKTGKKILIVIGFFTYAAVFFITSFSNNRAIGSVHFYGILIAVLAGIPMAILGILPQACVADVSELNTLQTGEDRSGMFFAARTFAMKMGQALSMLIYTSMTVSKLRESGVTEVSDYQYRNVAVVATVACLAGAVLFLFYREKSILNRIESMKAQKKG